MKLVAAAMRFRCHEILEPADGIAVNANEFSAGLFDDQLASFLPWRALDLVRNVGKCARFMPLAFESAVGSSSTDISASVAPLGSVETSVVSENNLLLLEYFPVHMRLYRDAVRKCLQNFLDLASAKTGLKMALILSDGIGLTFSEEKQLFPDCHSSLVTTITLNPVAKTFLKKALSISPVKLNLRPELLDELVTISAGDIRKFIGNVVWHHTTKPLKTLRKSLTQFRCEESKFSLPESVNFFQALGHTLFPQKGEIESFDSLIIRLSKCSSLSPSLLMAYLFENYLQFVSDDDNESLDELAELADGFSSIRFLVDSFPFASNSLAIQDDCLYLTARILQLRSHFKAPANISNWVKPPKMDHHRLFYKRAS